MKKQVPASYAQAIYHAERAFRFTAADGSSRFGPSHRRVRPTSSAWSTTLRIERMGSISQPIRSCWPGRRPTRSRTIGAARGS